MVFASWLSLIQVSILPQRLQPLPGWTFSSCWAPSSSPTPFAALSTDACIVHELTAMQDPKMSRRCQLPPPAHRGCASPAAAPQGSAVGWGPRIPPKIPRELEWAEAEQGPGSVPEFFRGGVRGAHRLCALHLSQLWFWFLPQSGDVQSSGWCLLSELLQDKEAPERGTGEPLGFLQKAALLQPWSHLCSGSEGAQKPRVGSSGWAAPGKCSKQGPRVPRRVA